VAIALDGEPARDEPAIVLNTYWSTEPVCLSASRTPSPRSPSPESLDVSEAWPCAAVDRIASARRTDPNRVGGRFHERGIGSSARPDSPARRRCGAPPGRRRELRRRVGAGSDAIVIVVGMHKQLPRDIYEDVGPSAGSSLELPCRRVLPVVAKRPSRMAARLLGRVSGLLATSRNVYCVHRRLKEVKWQRSVAGKVR